MAVGGVPIITEGENKGYTGPAPHWTKILSEIEARDAAFESRIHRQQPLSCESREVPPSPDEPGRGETREEHDRPVDAVDSPHPRATRKMGAPARKIGRMRMSRGMTVDSGAADNVMPRKMIRKRNRIRASAASRAGVYYVSASDDRIPNEGEVDFPFETKDGTAHEWTFQVADVNKVLAAVSAMVDAGYRVTFDKDMKTGIDISFIYHKETGKVIKMRRDRNVWVIDTYVESDEPNSADLDFARRE